MVVDQKTVRHCDARKAALRRPNWICAPVDLKTLQVFGVSPVKLPSSVLKVWKSLSKKSPGGSYSLDEHDKRHVEGRIIGILAMLATPFLDTLYLDSDTIPCFDMRTLFSMTGLQAGAPEDEENGVSGLLEYEDILIAYEYRTIRGFLGEDAMGMPDALGLLNTGVMLYRARNRVLDFLTHWLELYLKALHRKIRGRTADHFSNNLQRQPAMQWAMYHGMANSGLRVHPLSPVWNARSWQSALFGINKHDPKKFYPCCNAHHLTMSTIVIDHHCNISE